MFNRISKIAEYVKSLFLSTNGISEDSISDINSVFNVDKTTVTAKFDKYKSIDPYPSIPPALLNSVDIHNYILATGMVSPYYPSQLKPVTYGIKLTNADYIYWEYGKRIAGNFRNLNEVDEDGDLAFTIKSNSIMYVSLESYLRLPSYIAARFNLKINYIHKGILLGTGPVVDPGFIGKLCIPLHNLTNNDYKIKINSTFIWMEFTKISPNKLWSNNSKEESRYDIDVVNYDNDQKDRIDRKISDYIQNANPNGSISSSIAAHKEEVGRALEKAEKALEKTEGLNKLFQWGVLISITAIIVTLFVFMFKSHIFDDNKNEINSMQNQINTLNTKIDTLNSSILELKKPIEPQEQLPKSP